MAARCIFFSFRVALFACLTIGLSFRLFAAQPLDESSSAEITIKVGILYSTVGQRGMLQELANEFEKQNPNVKVWYEGHTDTKYKQIVPQWLSADDGVDVMYWQGGLRLREYIQAGQIHDISSIWYEHNLAQAFPQSIVDVVSDGEGIYGIPYAYYSWGMLYNKHLLDSLSMSAPQTWRDLKTLCHRAKQQNLFPITVAGLEPWLPVAWFDYINLRLNGLDFHLSLLRGDQSFLSKKVTGVFTHLAELIEADCFNSDYSSLHWRHAMTSIYRKLAVSTLIANFVDVSLPEEYLADFVFHSFPVIDPDIPRFENMPVDLFLIPKNSKKKQAAEKFLLFMSRPEVQHAVGNALAQSSPHIKALPPTGRFTQRNKEILQYADGLAQYFDRDMPPAMVQESLVIINGFFSDADIEKTQRALEDVRLRYLKLIQTDN